MKENRKIKRVLITGAGSGIGLACVELFLANGWHVYAHYHRTDQALLHLQKVVNDKALYLLKADFTSYKSVKAFLARIKKFSLDALVNNAAVYDVSAKAALRLTGASSVLLANTITPALIAESVIDGMKKRKKGNIVNVSSIGVKYGSARANMFYGASKGALEVITRSLARDGAPLGVLVNTVRPGVTDTPFHKKHKRNLSKRAKLIPLKRLAQAEEVAKQIYLLCAENTFMTGEIISVAGGE